MSSLSPIAVGLALAATMATASAQTVVSRTVSEELVETIVTQDGRGTVITRRIMPGQATAPVQPYVQPYQQPYVQPYAAPVRPYAAPVVAYEPAPYYPPRRPPTRHRRWPTGRRPMHRACKRWSSPRRSMIVTTRQYVAGAAVTRVSVVSRKPRLWHARTLARSGAHSGRLC